MKRLLAFAVLLVVLASAPVRAEPGSADARTGLTFIYVGAEDCPPCHAWRRETLPGFQQSAERKAFHFTMIVTATFKFVGDSYYWPEELRWVRD
jgi:hypothetical protein